eukprot:5752008-Prymnesium_polylepis.1
MAYDVVYAEDPDEVSYSSESEAVRRLSDKEKREVVADDTWARTPKRKRGGMVRDVGGWVPGKAKRATGNRFD